MIEKNLTLLPDEQLPQTDEPKKKEKVNILQEMLAEIMSERNITPAEVQKATGIPWGTIHSWMVGSVDCQKADKNLLKLAQYLNVSLFYLLYGIGSDDPYFENGDTDESA